MESDQETLKGKQKNLNPVAKGEQSESFHLKNRKKIVHALFCSISKILISWVAGILAGFGNHLSARWLGKIFVLLQCRMASSAAAPLWKHLGVISMQCGGNLN